VIRQAAAHVRLTVEMPDEVGLVLRFGEQLDTQTVNGGPTGELTPEHAARYIAKYATKSAEDFGLGDRRISPETLSLLDVNDHVDRLVRTAWRLGEHPAYAGLRRWVHMIGFRGLLPGLAVQGLGGAPGFPEHGLNPGAGLVDHILGLVLRLGDQERTVSLRLVKCPVRIVVGLGGHLSAMSSAPATALA